MTSMTLLPALVLRLRPGFIVAPAGRRSPLAGIRVVASVALVLALALLLVPRLAHAQEPMSADDIVRAVNAVDDGRFVTRNLTLTLVDRHGKERQRETITYRKYFGEEMRTVVFYLAPANVRDTAFLTWDYPAADQEDDQWLYLPALRKARRISAADRGDYFLGTDFTYEDIKLDGKLEPADYAFSLLEEQAGADRRYYRLEGVPHSAAVAAELGYSRMEVTVDAENWMITGVKFWDLKQQPLKTLEVSDIVQVDGIWTRRRLTMANHQTGHQTRFDFTAIDYATPIDDALFTRRALEQGR